MGIPVLVANGPNNLKIPCRVFACSMEEAKSEMVQLLGEPMEPRAGDPGPKWIWKDSDYPGVKEGTVQSATGAILPISTFFTRYYNGNGGPGSMTLIEVEPNKPFIGWDLD